MTTYIDVTQQSADALHLKEFEVMVQNTDDAMFFIDKGRISAINLAVERMFGGNGAQIIGLSPADLSPPKQADGRSSFLAAEEYTSQAFVVGAQRFLWQHRRLDGGLFTVQVSLCAVEGFPDRLVAVLRDVTDEQETARSLARSEARFKSIIAVSNTGTWEFHGQTGYLWCSDEYFTMLGFDPEKFVMDGSPNLKETWIDLLHSEDRERASAHFAMYLQCGSVGMYENYFRMRHADGSWVWIWSRGQTLRNPDGSLSDVTVGTHINITQRKQLENDLIQHQERLEAMVSERTTELVKAKEEAEPSSQLSTLSLKSRGFT